MAEVPIGDTTTAEQLRGRLVDVGTTLLVEVLDGELPQPTPQTGEATYAEKLRPEEWQLDWSEPAVALSRWVRAGRAWTTFRGKRLGVLAARWARSMTRTGRRTDANTRRGWSTPRAVQSPRVPGPWSSSRSSQRDGRRCRGPTSPTAPSPAPANASGSVTTE